MNLIPFPNRIDTMNHELVNDVGWVGKKAGRGFYDYRGDTPVPTR